MIKFTFGLALLLVAAGVRHAAAREGRVVVRELTAACAVEEMGKDLELPFGRATLKQGKMYLHVREWPGNRTLRVPVSNRIQRAYLLGNPEKDLPVLWQAESPVHVTLPEKAPEALPAVLVMEIEGEAKMVELPRVVRAGKDGSLMLLAIDAEVFARRARIEKKGENPPNIGYWTDVKDYVKWEVAIDRPGTYEVELEYSAAPNSGGSEYVIEVMGEAVKGKIAATESFLDFKTIRVGTVEVKEAGRSVVIVRPVTKPGVAVMDLRSVMLRPN